MIWALCSCVGVWNDGHFHKVHAQTRMHKEQMTRSPAARVHNAAGVEIIAENLNLFREKAAQLI